MNKDFINSTTMLMSIFIVVLLVWLVSMMWDVKYDMWQQKAQWQIFLQHYHNTLNVEIDTKLDI